MAMRDMVGEDGGLSEGRWGLRVYAVLGLCGVSALLALYLTGSGAGTAIPGCGAGSGCEAVLGSRFSKVGGGEGLPVSMLAVFAYVMLAAATWPMDGLSPMQARLRPIARQAVAAGIIAAAAWFVFLQYAVVGGWCIGCMTLHGLGVAAAILALVGERGQWKVGGLLLGLVMAGSLALLQWFGPGVDAQERSAAGLAGSSGSSAPPWRVPGGYDLIERDGRLVGEPARVPMWGDVSSGRQVVLLYDLACPHCRSLHALLKRVGDVGVVAVAVPLHGRCNEYVSPEPPARFAESCERSLLSIAVFVAEPAMYEAFDAWCFSQQDVPTYEAMHAHAESLVGADRLQKALEHPHAAAMLRAGVALFGEMKQQGVAEVLPVLWETRSNGVLTGAVEDVSQIERLLAGELENSSETRNPNDE